MATPDDRTDKTLPVTREVGGEGGSFADPTLQRATFDEQLPRTQGEHGPRVGGARARANVPVQNDGSGHRDAVTNSDPNSGTIRYPTEPPLSPSAREGRRVGGFDWRSGAIGVAAGLAGAAIGLAVQRRRSRTSRED